MEQNKWVNLLSVCAAAGVLGGFMYSGQWETANTLAIMVVSGFLALAGVKRNGR